MYRVFAVDKWNMFTEHEGTEIAMVFLREKHLFSEEENEENHKGSQEQIILTQHKNHI